MVSLLPSRDRATPPHHSNYFFFLQHHPPGLFHGREERLIGVIHDFSPSVSQNSNRPIPYQMLHFPCGSFYLE
jgi:hypothetical protein